MGFILFCATLSLWGQAVHSHQINPAEDDSYKIPFPLPPRTLHSCMENRSEELLPGLAEPLRYRQGSCLFPSATSLSCSPAPQRQLLPKVFSPFQEHPSSAEHIPGFRGHPKPDYIWQWACQHLLLQEVCLSVLIYSFFLITWKSEFPISNINWTGCPFLSLETKAKITHWNCTNSACKDKQKTLKTSNP